MEPQPSSSKKNLYGRPKKGKWRGNSTSSNGRRAPIQNNLRHRQWGLLGRCVLFCLMQGWLYPLIELDILSARVYVIYNLRRKIHRCQGVQVYINWLWSCRHVFYLDWRRLSRVWESNPSWASNWHPSHKASTLCLVATSLIFFENFVKWKAGKFNINKLFFHFGKT